MSKTVLDVSSHQGTITWSKVKVDGVMIRLGYRGYGQGTLEMDKQFTNNANGCVNNGIPFGIYWFTTAISAAEGKEEAEFVLNKISNYKLSLPIFIDSEYSNASASGRSDKLSKSARTTAVKAFCERIQQAGYAVGVYASESWFKTNLDVSQLPYKYWVAKYSSAKPTYPTVYDSWQYTSSASMNGISTKVDLSYWYSDFTSTGGSANAVITNAVNPVKTKKKITPVSYLQTDSKWKNIRYGVKDETTTIGSAGCGPTSAAMVIASLVDSSVTPKTTAAWSLANGYKAYHQGTYYSYFKPQMAAYGIKCTQVNGASVYGGAGSAKSVNAKVLESVKNGNWMIACMGKGNWTSSGHFILWYAVDGNYVLINDPYSTKSSRLRAPISTFQSQVKFYFEIDVNSFLGNEEEYDMTEAEVIAIAEKWFTQRGQKAIDNAMKPDLDWAYERGIMKDGSYNRPATRAEVAVVAHRLHDIVMEQVDVKKN